jgi:DNA-binding transcriptional ArsR family regulator
MIEYQDAKRIAAMIAAIGEPTRMMILYRLAHSPHHVGQLAEALGVPMVNMSHHLGVMRQSGLLDDEKDGRRVVYKLRPDIHTPAEGDPEILGTLALGRYSFVIRRGKDGLGKPAAKRKPVKKSTTPTSSEVLA